MYRAPLVSSIRNKPSIDEICCILREIKISSSDHEILPEELVLRIQEDACYDSFYEQIRSAWVPILTHRITSKYMRQALWCRKHLSSTPDPSELHDRDLLTPGWREFVEWLYKEHSVRIRSALDNISIVDLLYRIRCFFPKISVNCTFSGNKRPCGWEVYLKHKETGMVICFLEWQGETELEICWPDTSIFDEPKSNLEIWNYYLTSKEYLTTDIIRLLDAFFETLDDQRLAYFHPAANAYLPLGDEHYPAVIKEIVRNEQVQSAWRHIPPAPTDLTSYNSLLPRMKYNLESHQVDLINGTADLTTIISSSLLFHRLLSYFYLREFDDNSNVNIIDPITSVWQIKLLRCYPRIPVLFMDDRGCFDIRVGEHSEKIMDDIVLLLNFLLATGDVVA